MEYDPNLYGGGFGGGTVIDTRLQSAFGEPILANLSGAATTAATEFGYTGRRRLGNSGLYDYRNRIYDPALGRFLTPDPLGTKPGMNLYGYVNGDPVNQVDPNGLDPRDWFGIGKNRKSTWWAAAKEFAGNLIPSAKTGGLALANAVTLGKSKTIRCALVANQKAMGMTLAQRRRHNQVAASAVAATLMALGGVTSLRYFGGAQTEFMVGAMRAGTTSRAVVSTGLVVTGSGAGLGTYVVAAQAANFTPGGHADKDTPSIVETSQATLTLAFPGPGGSPGSVGDQIQWGRGKYPPSIRPTIRPTTSKNSMDSGLSWLFQRGSGNARLQDCSQEALWMLEASGGNGRILKVVGTKYGTYIPERGASADGVPKLSGGLGAGGPYPHHYIFVHSSGMVMDPFIGRNAIPLGQYRALMTKLGGEEGGVWSLREVTLKQVRDAVPGGPKAVRPLPRWD